MALRDDITDATNTIVGASWSIREGQVVPKTADVALTNGGVKLDAVYLYADMADSTGLARDFSRQTAAKVVRAYLDASCRVIKAYGGEIRSFDGDRVMAIFIGSRMNTRAALCGLQISYVVGKIVRPAIELKLPAIVEKGFELDHCVGIASGPALVVRGGVRGSNDLVSIGRAPNLAAKLSDIRNSPYRTYVTKPVFDALARDGKVSTSQTSMWEGPRTREVGGETITVYRSNWRVWR